jgi:hypothetical protein
MKRFPTIAVLLLALFIAAPVLAKTAHLYLWKRDPNAYGSCGNCSQYLSFTENQDRTNLSDYPQAHQTGYFYFHLDGPPGATVTLFGLPDFASQQGYLIVVKKDHRQILVPDLEAYSPEQWVDVPEVEGEAGGFAVYYKPSANFKNNVSSVKWGKWWDAAQVPTPTH